MEGFFVGGNMNKILLIAEEQRLLDWWERIISIASVNTSIQTALVQKYLQESLETKENYLKNATITVLVTHGRDPAIVKGPILQECESRGIPVIITEEDVAHFKTLACMLTTGVRGVVSVQLSIITLSEIIQTVSEGGIYVRPKSKRL